MDDQWVKSRSETLKIVKQEACKKELLTFDKSY